MACNLKVYYKNLIMKNYFLTGFAAMIIAATTISATHSNSITALASLTNTAYDTVPGSNPNNNPNNNNPNSSNPSTNNPDRNNPNNNNNMDNRKDSTTRMYDTSTMHRDSLLQR